MVGKKRVAAVKKKPPAKRWVALRPTTERDEQEKLCKWLTLQYPDVVFFSVPNDGKRTDARKFHLHAVGMLSGAPDLVILSKQPIFVEMKRVKGGHVSKEQKMVHAWIRALGYHMLVCKGFDDARKQLTPLL